jgi:hypothetical protein
MLKFKGIDGLKFLLEKKLARIFGQMGIPENWQPTGLTKDFYTQLSEPIVRQAVAWQSKEVLAKAGKEML